MSVVADVVLIDRALDFLDLTAPIGVLNPNGMTYLVTSIGADVYEVSLTGDGSVRDGSNEGVTLRFSIRGPEGDVVDITDKRSIVRLRMEIVSAAVGDSLLVHVGVKSQGSTGGAGVPRFAGFSTDTGVIDRSTCNSLTSNSTTGTAGLSVILLDLVPIATTSGTWEFGLAKINTLTSAGALINSTELSSAVDAAPGTCEIQVLLGYDAAHLLTHTAQIKISAIALQVAE